ncbi:class I SAM-dependent methyltransferase [Bacillus cereus]|nr:class I SAM-dependent methyltransferase [Bacillus cereus]
MDCLPKYGPYTASEDEIQSEIKKFLILGLDLSSAQIEIANETLKSWDPKLVWGEMEEELNIPKGYFDIVYSIYALNWTSDLRKTLELIYSYVKPGGSFIFSWEHPVYSNLQYGTEEVAIKSSYHEETPITFETFKGENVQATLYKRKISTYINELDRAGFKIERIEEPEPSSSLDGELAEPSTFIIKARK